MNFVETYFSGFHLEPIEVYILAAIVFFIFIKWTYPVTAGVFLIFMTLISPVLVAIALPTVKWDDEETTGSYGLYPTIRGNLHWFFKFLETPDERLPGGLYEPTMKAMLEKRGKYWTSWWWLGMRNQCMNLACWMGKKTTDYIPETLGYWERDNIWRYAFQIGIFKFVFGWQVYKTLDGSFAAAPVTAIKIKRD